MQPLIPKSILPSGVLLGPPPQWQVTPKGWALREESLEEGKLFLDLEGEKGPKLALWGGGGGCSSTWAMVHAKAEGWEFVLPFQER